MFKIFYFLIEFKTKIVFIKFYKLKIIHEILKIFYNLFNNITLCM